MALKESNIIGSLAIFVLLTTLLLGTYNVFQDKYGITRTDLKNGKDVIQKLTDLTIIEGLNAVVNALYKLGSPTGSIADVLGGLAAIAGGVIKIGFGLIAFPAQILGIVFEYYSLPAIIGQVMGILIIVYFGYVLIRNYLGQEN